MKAGEITECALCGQGLMARGLPLFWRVRLERMGLSLAAVARVQGLEALTLGNIALARAERGLGE